VAFSLDALKEKHNVKITWHSYELRPAGTIVPPAKREQILSARPRFIEHMKQLHGVDIQFGPFGIDSRPALIGAKYAEGQSEALGEAYHNGILEAYWLNGRDISDPAVLTDIATTAGLDGPTFADALNASQWNDQVTADVERAYMYGLSGVPALVFANKYLVMGAQPLEVLEEVVAKVQAELSTSSS